MAKRIMAAVMVLIVSCFLFLDCRVTAVSTTDASEPININQKCVLTLVYTCDQTAFEDVSVKLYEIADVSSDFHYSTTSVFKSLQLNLNGVETNDEWKTIGSTLEAYIIADNIKADAVAKTDSEGRVRFEQLKPGLYFATVEKMTQKNTTCLFDSAIVALPGLNADNHWQYEVTVAPKFEIISPSDKEITLTVRKLWKGDERSNSRPKNIDIEIFKDATSYKKTVLSQEDNWSYSWTTKDDGSKWTVIEKNNPSGYAMTVDKRNKSFILINTFVSQNSDEFIDGPQTGDTSNIMLYVTLMIISGIMLIILSIMGKRNRYEEK